jgi:glycine cleavage system protein P-like pyridoxal-binding family
MQVVRAYHEHRGDGARTRVLIPDSAHGTNPATARMVGYHVQSIPSDDAAICSSTRCDGRLGRMSPRS